MRSSASHAARFSSTSAIRRKSSRASGSTCSIAATSRRPRLPQASLLAIFDLGWYAPTFDIFEFALNARVWAQRRGIPRVSLVILRRPFSGALRRQPQLPPHYDFRLHDILLGASSLLGVDDVELTGDVEAAGTRAAGARDRVFPPDWSAQLSPEKLETHRYYLERFMRDHLATGAQYPGIRIPATAYVKIATLLRGAPRPWLSITARQTPYQQARNSNEQTWQAVRRHFERRGATVVFVPDIESPLDFHAAAPLAALAAANVVYRAALYDACDLNLGVVGGSMAGAQFNPSAAMIMAKFGIEGSNASAQRMQDLLGMQPGSPMFYRMPWQQALWEGDGDADGLIRRAATMLEFVASLRDAIASSTLLRDPWGKPDGTLHGLWASVRPGMKQREMADALAAAERSASIAGLRQTSPFSSKPWVMEADALLAAGDFAGALESARHALRLENRFPRTYLIAARCLRAAGDGALADRYEATARTLP
jgi:hypothetical protein